MKTKITTLLMALCLGGATYAQQNCSQPTIGADAKLLSTTTEGDCTVKRYLVKEGSADNDEFSVRYKVNLARLITTYSSNAEELKGLHSFVHELQQDTLKKITSVNIMGYASPDGTVNINEELAMNRAQDFRKYLNQNYDMSRYSGSTRAKVYTWREIADAINTSDIPQKAAVLDVVKSDMIASAIESKLKTMPQAWAYLTKNILPQFRCVELCVKYNSWKIVETRTSKNGRQATSPNLVRNVTNNYYLIVEDNPEGMIVNTSTSPLDWEDCKTKEKEKFKMRRHHERVKARERDGYERLYLYERGRIRR